jgi:hypothetical protein
MRVSIPNTKKPDTQSSTKSTINVEIGRMMAVVFFMIL